MACGERAKLAAVRAVAAEAAAAAATYTPPTVTVRGFDLTLFKDHLLKSLTERSEETYGWPLLRDDVLNSIGWPAGVPLATRTVWLEANPDVWVVGKYVMRAGDEVAITFVDDLMEIYKVDDATAAAAAASGPDPVGVLTTRVKELEAEVESLRESVAKAERGAGHAWRLLWDLGRAHMKVMKDETESTQEKAGEGTKEK